MSITDEKIKFMKAATNSDVGAVVDLEMKFYKKGMPEQVTVVNTIQDATPIAKSILWASDAQTIRNIIGAGTSNLTIGNTASTAKVGNYTVTWSTLPDKPSTIAAGSDAASARAAIGAGTSSLVIGTTATTAKAGNYQPTWSDVSGKPAVIASGADIASARASIGAGTSNLTVGLVAGTAKAGEWKPACEDLTNATALGISIMKATSASQIRTLLGILL